MNPNLQHNTSIDEIDDCCCHHCCCCCYYQQEKEQIKQKQSEIIPPWSSTISTHEACCSCSSSIKEHHTSFPSTQCTTPENFVPKEDENATPDIDKLTKKKLHAIDELLQTERIYVNDLIYLVHVCLEVLSRQPWITPEEVSTIARNSNEILKFHKNFILDVDTTPAINNDWSFIAIAFMDQIQQFSLYKNYCDLHAEAWALASEYRDKPEWTSFLKDCDTYSIPPEILSNNTLYQQQQRKLHFEDYLIKPVQRICRYQLLVREIIRYTSTQTTEYDLWNNVLNEMQNIVTEIDDRKLQRDIQERTCRFIDRLDADWRISKRHVTQLGNLLVAGAIEVTYSALGQSVSKPRYLGCFVFPTYIIMVRPKKVTNYEPKHWFPLRMAEFEDLTDEGQKDHSFVVRCKKHTFAFSASCSQEKQLWVKKIQEAIVAAKIEASDENLSAQDFIVSSLPGITSKRSPQSIRLSRSFTNILDMTIAGSTSMQDNQPMSTMDRKHLRRSASATIHFEEIMKLHPTEPKPTTLKKRYSVDYSALKSERVHLKPRNHSEMYFKPDPFPGQPRRRPSSLDLLAGNSNMIGKFKNNHQNALRVTVDHKLRDVCTQDYLSSKALHMREKDQADSPVPYPINRSGSNAGSPNPLKKHKSSSFIRSSASSFSLMMPKRNESKSRPVQSELDIDSTSSCSSSFINTKEAGSRRVSQSSQLAHRTSPSLRFLSESPESFESEHSLFNGKGLEKSPSRRKLFVGRVLRRISSLHHKYPPSRFDKKPSFEELTMVKKAASVDTRSITKKWAKHEELIQLQVSDLPVQNNEESKLSTTITAFAYASTPPPSNVRMKKNEGNKWRNRLSLMRPTSFIKLNHSDN